MAGISYWLFDLDNTLYPASSGLFGAIDGRINRYLEEFCAVAPGEADRLRRHYFTEYGLTLVGLMRERGTDPHHYLEYVHDVPVAEYLRPDDRLRSALESISVPRGIFTNGSRRHSRAVTEALGIADLFGAVFDIADTGFVPKPDPRSYRTVLDRLGVPADSVAFVEDLPRNLVPARELGMTTVLVGKGGGGDGAADYAIDSLADLPGVLGDLSA